mmetsp:Transcript_29134/g.61506  ORF Transcript_29134/g.61506 Transcript_29134/m.61506 type:complete len:527 (-) Transcript_29134:162-1742(-)
MGRIKNVENMKECHRRRTIFVAFFTLLMLPKEVSCFTTPPTAFAAIQSYQPRRDDRSHVRMQTRDQSDRAHDYGTSISESSEDYMHALPNSQGRKAMTVNHHDRNTFSHFPTVCASIALGLSLVFSVPLDANAGFGPSSGATTSSPPNLIAPSIQDRDIEYNAKKLKQLIGSTLDENRLREFSIQLDELTESMTKFLSTDYDVAEGEEAPPVDTAAMKDREVELEKARVLQKQIADREKLLATLEKQPYWFNYLAAFVGSVASTLVMHPVDTIKTRLQVKQERFDDEEDDHNLLTLYEGLTGNILKEGPPSALYLGVYETVKYALLPQFGADYKLLVYLVAGAAGELVGSIVRSPAEAIKSTVQSGITGSASEAAIQVFGTVESRKNVVRAWSSSVWRDVPFGAIQLAIFELLKAYILNNPDIDFDSSTLLSEALIGAFAGGFGALLTNPFDIITTRIITQSTGDNDSDAKPLGVLEMAKKVYGEGGHSAFWVGWQARVGYWAPAISIFLTCYCSVRQAGVQNNWF